MFDILTLNKIAACGLSQLDGAKYAITDDATKDADGIILRSFKMHDMELLPSLKEKITIVHNIHKKLWLQTNKTFGLPNLDIRYGGVASRCDTASELIYSYLDGTIDVLDELEETRLDKGLSAFAHYSNIAIPTLEI